MSKHSLTIEKSIKYIAIPLYALSAICFMIYTTEQSYTYADSSIEDLGYDITSANASVTVGTACTFTGTITSPHNATITNGINSTNIGTTILNTTCNDSGGYALYAIGFTEDEYGSTALTYTSPDGTTTNSDYNIATGTATSGSTSNWSMKLSPVAGTTTASIENDYSSYNIVPDDYTKVATLNTVTDSANTSTPTGSSVSTTYQTYISPTQPAGTYTGKVKYTLVHPSTAPAPTFMQNTTKIKSLLVNEGDTMQAIDKRDGKKYWITKLADGNIWMTQNLDFDIDSTKTYTSADTNISSDWTPANSTISFTSTSVNGWVDSEVAPYSADPGELYIYSSGTTNDDDQYTSLANCQAAHPDCSMHNHVGNYYNWPAAVASNNIPTLNTQNDNTSDSICPAGWGLPTNVYGNNPTTVKEWAFLLASEDITTDFTDKDYSYTSNGFNIIRKAPLWLVRSGSISYGSLYDTASSGNYWSSMAYGNTHASTLYFRATSASSTSDARYHGYTVRCLAR